MERLTKGNNDIYKTQKNMVPALTPLWYATKGLDAAKGNIILGSRSVIDQSILRCLKGVQGRYVVKYPIQTYDCWCGRKLIYISSRI